MTVINPAAFAAAVRVLESGTPLLVLPWHRAAVAAVEAMARVLDLRFTSAGLATIVQLNPFH